MCIGVPMCVVEEGKGFSICERRGDRRRIDMRLVGDQPAGTHVLVFLDTAREVVSAGQARLVAQALDALNLAMVGSVEPADIDRLFPDLANREPELPEHLKSS